jgi:hypothetical protein
MRLLDNLCILWRGTAADWVRFSLLGLKNQTPPLASACRNRGKHGPIRLGTFISEPGELGIYGSLYPLSVTVSANRALLFRHLPVTSGLYCGGK